MGFAARNLSMYNLSMYNDMKLDLNIDSLRGSLFLPRLPFDWDVASAIKDVLPDHIPTVVTDFPQIINNTQLFKDDWALFTPERNSMFLVQQQKVDYIVTGIKAYSQDYIKEFAETCANLFAIILSLKNEDSKRLAFAPSFVYNGEREIYKKLLDAVIAKKTFKDTAMDNCEFSQVFRVAEKICDREYIINYLSRFYTRASWVNENDRAVMKDVDLIDFDINTFVDTTYSFGTASVKDFFGKASAYCEDFMNWYSDMINE